MKSLRRLGTLLGVLALALVLLTLSLDSGYAATFVVDSTGDSVDASSGDGFCDAGSGKCTLRATPISAN